MACLLEVKSVAKRYEGAAGAPDVEVLRDVTLELAAGDAVAIVGPSGSGKSTLLNIIGTLDRPTSGAVVLEGLDVTELGDEECAALRAGAIGFVFQQHHVLPHLTVLENALVPALVTAGGADGAAADRARKLLERVGLGARIGHLPGQLSGGERQRVAVVRALINRPRLLLADEPTGSLDRAAAASLTDLLVELNRDEGVTMIVVTHALEVARRLRRVLELREGKLVAAEAEP